MTTRYNLRDEKGKLDLFLDGALIRQKIQHELKKVGLTVPPCLLMLTELQGVSLRLSGPWVSTKSVIIGCADETRVDRGPDEGSVIHLRLHTSASIARLTLSYHSSDMHWIPRCMLYIGEDGTMTGTLEAELNSLQIQSEGPISVTNTRMNGPAKQSARKSGIYRSWKLEISATSNTLDKFRYTADMFLSGVQCEMGWSFPRGFLGLTIQKATPKMTESPDDYQQTSSAAQSIPDTQNPGDDGERAPGANSSGTLTNPNTPLSPGRSQDSRFNWYSEWRGKGQTANQDGSDEDVAPFSLESAGSSKKRRRSESGSSLGPKRGRFYETDGHDSH